MILVDGHETSLVPATDSSVIRGDGVFEALRTLDGVPFALAEHMDRLERSAAAMDLGSIDRRALEDWIRAAAVARGEALIRVVLTRGDASSGGRTIVMSQPLPEVPEPFSVFPHRAPWHPGGRQWELSGVKTLSYAPNLAATRVAQRSGYSDALLLSDEGIVLEGPTFCVGWLVDGVFETPTLDLGILASITRAQTIDVLASIGCEVVEGRFEIDRLLGASDVVAMSTVKQVKSISRCGDHALGRTDWSQRLCTAFAEMVDERIGR